MKKQLIKEGKLDKYGKPNASTPKDWASGAATPAAAATPMAVDEEKKRKHESDSEETKTPKKDKKKKKEVGNSQLYVSNELGCGG